MSEPLEPSLNNHFKATPMPLEQFEATIQEVLGMLYSGSLGHGTADRFSDLDIELWVTDAAFLERERKISEVLRYLGTVHFFYARGSGCTAFVGDEWQRVDVWLHQMSEVDLPSEYAHARIIKDTDHFLAHLLEGVREKAVIVSWEEARSSIEEAIDSQIYLSLHNARGAIWSAMEEVSDHAMELYV
jgi:hypothetical protein